MAMFEGGSVGQQIDLLALASPPLDWVPPPAFETDWTDDDRRAFAAGWDYHRASGVRSDTTDDPS